MRKITSVLLAVAMTLSVTACGKPDGPDEHATTATVITTEAQTVQDTETLPQPTKQASATEEATPEKTYYPVTVKDQAGREVTIESEPQKLVSGYYISTSLLMALGLTDRIVGIEAKANKRPIYKLSAPGLIDLPNVGSAKEFDLEGCAALEPDLVILPKKLKDAAATLTELGIRVLLVNPEDQDLLLEMADIIATATNTQDKKKELAGFIAQQQKTLSEKLADTEKPSVYLAGNSDFFSTAGDAMYQSALIELAGGVNVAADVKDTYWVETSYEQVLSWNPEYIIIASDAGYTVDSIYEDANLSSVAAVVNKHVYKLPADAESWDSPVPGGILGAVWVANVLHPEQITDDVRTSAIEVFYEKFYGFKYGEK